MNGISTCSLEASCSTKELEDIASSTISKLETAKANFLVAGKVYEMEQKICTVWNERELGPRPRHPNGKWIASWELIDDGRVNISSSLLGLISKAMEIKELAELDELGDTIKEMEKATRAFTSFGGRFGK